MEPSGSEWIRGVFRWSRADPSGFEVEPSGAEWIRVVLRRSQVEPSGFEVEPSGAEWIRVVLRWSQAEPSGSKWFLGVIEMKESIQLLLGLPHYGNTMQRYD